MNILMPLPHQDFDPTEVCITWRILCDAGHDVHFATPEGWPAEADPLMISGEGLDVWGCVPGLKKIKFVGLLLRAQASTRQAYAQIQVDPQFKRPMTYQQAMARDLVTPFDALVLPGGHAKGMRTYLESKVLQNLVVRFFEPQRSSGLHRPVAAVCHGVLLAARSRHAVTGRSVLWGRKTTALTWKLEKSAWDLTRWWARFWDPTYYRTYTEAAGEPAGYWGVEAEVKRALVSDADFVDVPADAPHHWRKTSGLCRDRDDDTRAAWVVQDGPYLSARWPGDVHTLAHRFVDCLSQRQGSD